MEPDFYGVKWDEVTGPTYLFGTYIDQTAESITMRISSDKIDGENKILSNYEQEINRLLAIKANSYDLEVPNGTIIPASIFATLQASNTQMMIWSRQTVLNYFFQGSNITNTSVDFKFYIEESKGTPISDMVDTGDNKAIYLNFGNEGGVPGKARISNCGGFVSDGEMEILDLYIYSYNNTTKKYTLVSDKGEFFCGEFYICEMEPTGKQVLVTTKLPNTLVEDDKQQDDTPTPNPTPTPSPAPSQSSSSTQVVASAAKTDTTIREGKILYAGETTIIIVSMIVVAIMGVICYIKSEELKGI